MQFARTDPTSPTLPMKASDYIRRQVKFTPFAKDDVGWILDQVGPDLLLFSTDFPHPEGPRIRWGDSRAPARFDDDTARSSTSRTCASCSVPPSFTAEDKAALGAAMRVGMAPAFWAGATPPAGDGRAERRPLLRRAQRPRQPLVRASPAAAARATRSRCCAATGRSSPRRGRRCNRAGLPAHQRQLAPHARRGRLHRPRLPGQAFIADATHAGAVPPAEHVELRIAVGGELPGFEPWDDVLAAEDGTRHRRPEHGHRDALHVGHHGLPEGRRQAARPRRAHRGGGVYGYRDGNVHLCTGPLYHAAPRSPSGWCRRSPAACRW